MFQKWTSPKHNWQKSNQMFSEVRRLKTENGNHDGAYVRGKYYCILKLGVLSLKKGSTAELSF